MRIPALFACLLVIFLSVSSSGQSRRVSPANPNQKQNSRPAAPSPTPTPTPKQEDEAPVDDPNAVDTGEVISVDTRLVSIPVRVLDRKNRFISNLRQENFRVFEENVEQQIAHFSNETQPFTVALVLDMSYSTTFKIGEIQSAAIAFIDQLRPEDKVIVISFDQEVHMLSEATSDREQIYRAIRSTRIGTGTSLYEAVDLTMNQRLRRIEGRKAIVLFTDGVDTTSRTSHDLENLRDAMELDALIYSIRYDTFADVQSMKNKPVINPPGSKPAGTPPIGPTSNPFPIPLPGGTIPGPVIATPSDKGTTPKEYAEAEEYLNQLAYRTGGRTFLAATVGNLNQAFSSIASELREYYSIGYYPTEEGKPGKHRRVKVRVDQPDAAVKARDSYVVAKKQSGI